ncbi:uncharacterized protein [Heterodontus francisci]|uniref:uncharacterized protein n=1 Tax=Heterodontus francisci TaxID=7792 RepID=UPI00355C6E3F
MGTQGSGRKRIANRERLCAEDDTLNVIAREAEARLAAKRAARAEAREIRMKELERQQKEKYYGLDTKFGDIEQWMEDSEKYSRRFRRHTSVSDEDDWTSVGSRGSVRPSEHNCFLGSGSRTSSRASSARASPVVEERLEKDFTEKGSRAASSLSAATLASLGGTSSRRGSGETTTSMDTEGSIREIKDSLAEVEEKYKKAMVSNAQLDNEKTNLMYQVDTLRESLLELEEQLAEMHRRHEEKTKELDRQKHAYSILQHQFEVMKATVKEREEMLVAYGLLTNGEAEPVRKDGNAHTEAAQTGPQAAAQLQNSSDGPLGESHGLQMSNEILETVGKREVLQNAGIDEQMEETGNREMLMDNVQAKDITEKCEEVTESETPAVTVRDNGDTDQIERAAPNLDDGEQSACDTQNTGGKEVSEGINSALGSGGGMQGYGSGEEESESDLGVNGKQVQENVNRDEGSQSDRGDSKHPEVGNGVGVVHVDSVGTGAGNQTIVEETQKIVQQVLENAIEILQQRTCGHELQEESRDEEEEVTQVGVGTVQVKGDNLTRMQEKPAESVHVEEKELDGVLIKEMAYEQAAVGDIKLHSAAQRREICSGSLHDDVARGSGEAGQVLTVAPDQNGKSRPGGEDMDSMDGPLQEGAENGERNDQEGSDQQEELEERAEIRNSSLTPVALQEVDEGEEVVCQLKGMRGPVVQDEVKQAFVPNEDPEWRDEVAVTGRAEGCLQDGEVKDLGRETERRPCEAESDPDAEQGDGAGQVVQQGKVDDNLDHGCLQEITLNEGENKAAVEIEAIKGEVRGHGEAEEKVKGLDTDEVKRLGEDEGEQNNTREGEVKGHEEGMGEDPDTSEAKSCGANKDMGVIKGHGDEREVKGLSAGEGRCNEGDKDKDSGHEQAESRNYEDETKDSNWDKVKGQGEKEGEAKDSEGQSEVEVCEEGKIEVDVPGEVNGEFKGKRDGNELQGRSASEKGSGEAEEGEVRGPREMKKKAGEEEAKGPREEKDEGEVKGPREEQGEVKGTREEEEDEVQIAREAESEVKGFREEEGDEDKVRGPSEEEEEEEEEEVKGGREAEDEVEVKGAREQEHEGEVKGTREDEEDKGEVKGAREQVDEGEAKGARGEEDEGEVKGTREEEDEGEVKGVREQEDEGEVKGAREDEDEVKGAREEEDEDVKSVREQEDEAEVKGAREEEDKGEVRGVREQEDEGEVQGAREEEDEDEVKGVREEEEEDEDEVRGVREQEDEGEVKGAREEEDEGEVKGAREEEDEGEFKGAREEEDEGEVKGAREEDEGEVKGARDEEDEGEVKDAREEEDEDEVKGAREQEDEGDVKGAREKEDEGEDKGPREEEEGEGEVKGAREDQDKGEVKGAREEEDEANGAREDEDEGEAKGAREEDEVRCPREEEEHEVKGHREKELEDEVRDHREEDKDEVQGVGEEEKEVKGKERANDAAASQTGVEKQVLGGDDKDVEEGSRFEWDEEMSKILRDETPDKQEAPECEEESGEASAGNEDEAKPIVIAGPSEQIKPNTDNVRTGVQTHHGQGAAPDGQGAAPEGQGAAPNGQGSVRTNSSNQQSNHSGGQPQDGDQGTESGTSVREGDTGEADEEMAQRAATAEAGKDSKRKSKSKEECSLSFEFGLELIFALYTMSHACSYFTVPTFTRPRPPAQFARFFTVFHEVHILHPRLDSSSDVPQRLCASQKRYKARFATEPSKAIFGQYWMADKQSDNLATLEELREVVFRYYGKGRNGLEGFKHGVQAKMGTELETATRSRILERKAQSKGRLGSANEIRPEPDTTRSDLARLLSFFSAPDPTIRTKPGLILAVPCDFRVKKFLDEKEALLEQIKKLKAQLDERTKSGKVEKAASSDAILENGTDVQVIEVQRDANRQISEYKFKLTKTEQEITALEQNIIRLESQVLRYKTAAENAEKVEDELKAEKRKLQREVRSALDKIEELEMSNSHLSKRLEKMKANRSALLSQQ